MLLFLIPIAWLAVLSLLVAICRVAAAGDARPAGPSRSQEDLIGIKLTLLPVAASHAGQQRLHARRTLLRPGIAGRRQRIAAHSLRQR
jgi:hypothetical protein